MSTHAPHAVERPDPVGEAYLYGSHTYRAEVDARPERVAAAARTAETHRVRLAAMCDAPTEGWVPPGETHRCEAAVIPGTRRCAMHESERP